MFIIRIFVPRLLVVTHVYFHSWKYMFPRCHSVLIKLPLASCALQPLDTLEKLAVLILLAAKGVPRLLIGC